MGTSKSYILPKTREYKLTKQAFTSTIKEFKKSGQLSTNLMGRLVGRLSNNVINENSNDKSFIRPLSSMLALIKGITDNNNQYWESTKNDYPQQIQQIYSALINSDKNAKDALEKDGFNLLLYSNPLEFFTALIRENSNIDGLNQEVILTALTNVLDNMEINNFDDLKEANFEEFVKLLLAESLFHSFIMRYYEDGTYKRMSHIEMENCEKQLKEYIENLISSYDFDNIISHKNIEQELKDKIEVVLEELKKMGD